MKIDQARKPSRLGIRLSEALEEVGEEVGEEDILKEGLFLEV